MEIKELHTIDNDMMKDLLGLMNELDPSITVTPEMLQMSATDPATHLFVVMEGGKTVGTASLSVYSTPTGRKADVEDVVVSSSCRGRSIGRLLMEHIINYAQENLSPVVLHLTSRPARVAANHLYQAVGFDRYDTNVYKLGI